ncbi:MAG: GNAT family N-acetyltransferase [Pyrinomonadaceae bacterium]
MIILETKRLILRTWKFDDAEDALKIWGNSDVMKYIGKPFENLDVAKKAMQNAISVQEKHRICLWAVVAKENQTIIGACGFHPVEDKVLEIAYHFIPEVWGKGFASETVQGCIEFAFTKLNIKKIVGFTDVENLGSQKVLEKNGFEFVEIVTFDEKPERSYELKKRF